MQRRREPWRWGEGRRADRAKRRRSASGCAMGAQRGPRDGQERGDRPSGLGLSVLFCMVGSSQESRTSVSDAAGQWARLWGLLLCELWRWEGEWWSGEGHEATPASAAAAELPARGEGGIGDGLGDECVEVIGCAATAARASSRSWDS